MSTNALNSDRESGILVVPPQESQEIIEGFRSKGYMTFTLDGKKLNSKTELLGELSQAMKFPDYFGNNWDALEECLNDLSWLAAKGYAIHLKEADNFVSKSAAEFHIFAQLIESVSRSWKSKNIDFVVLVETNNLASLSS